MKNQYVGDVNDYRKYGLIRALQKPGDLRVLVAWMLTPDDGGADGSFRQYIRKPHQWRGYDADLFDHLARSVDEVAAPSVRLIEQADVLPKARFYSAVVPDDGAGRAEWDARLLDSAADADLVFLDPDNGLEVKSKPVGRLGSSKYATWHEVESLYGGGCSVLVYQHYCREQRSVFQRRLADKMAECTGSSFVQGFATAHVLFLLAGQPRHAQSFAEAVAGLLPRWHGQISALDLSQQF